jgi:hypothetical protein
MVGLSRLFRRRRLPAGARPPLADDERIIAWASEAAFAAPEAAGVGARQAVVVVTNLGLWLPGASGPTRLGWHEIHKATWSGRALRVVPAYEVAAHETYVEMADADPLTATLLDPDKVPEQVRARVGKSVAYTSHHALPGGGVRVVARRVPGRDGLRWTVRYDPGTQPAPDAVAALVARGLASITGGQTVASSG